VSRSHREAELSIRLIWPFTRLLAERPGTAFSLARAGVHAAEFANPDTRLSHRVAMDLLSDAVKISGDPACGLRAGMQVEPGDFYVLEYAARAAANLGDAIRCIARYFRLMHDGLEVTLRETGDHVVWCHRMADGSPLPRAANDFSVAATITFVARNMVSPEPPAEVWFMHEAPEYAAEYEAAFRTKVRFGAKWNGVVLRAARLAQPMRQANPRVSHAFELHAKQLLERLERSDGVAGRVHAALLSELGAGDIGMSFAARKLAMSVATLRRRLESEGTTYSRILDDTRKQLAERYLGEATPSVSEVAFLLGFSNVTAFHRAFRRWNGVAPTEYRARRLAS